MRPFEIWCKRFGEWGVLDRLPNSDARITASDLDALTWFIRYYNIPFFIEWLEIA